MARCVRGIRTLPQSIIRRGLDWLLSNDPDPPEHVAGELVVEEPVVLGQSAEARARQLLLRMLSPAQRDEFECYGYFSVEVPGRGRFRILPRTRFNVLSVDTGLAYCAVPDVSVPVLDVMLAQKLILENDPGRFFRVANLRREEGNDVDAAAARQLFRG